jgi:hypothetical protein
VCSAPPASARCGPRGCCSSTACSWPTATPPRCSGACCRWPAGAASTCRYTASTLCCSPPGAAALHQGHGKGLESLESRAKAAARLDLEVSTGWASPSSRGLWGGDALLLSTKVTVGVGEPPRRKQSQGSSKIGYLEGSAGWASPFSRFYGVATLCCSPLTPARPVDTSCTALSLIPTVW